MGGVNGMWTTVLIATGSCLGGAVVGASAGVLGAARAMSRMRNRLTDAKQLAREVRDLEKRRQTSDFGTYLSPAGADPNRRGVRIQAGVTRPGRLSSLRSLRERG